MQCSLYNVGHAMLAICYSNDLITWQETEKMVTREEGIAFAQQYGHLFLECSAKTRENVEKCFEELALKVHFIKDMK